MSALVPAWIVMPPQILQTYLLSSFGDEGSAHLELRQLAKFDKPGLRVQLALYEATLR